MRSILVRVLRTPFRLAGMDVVPSRLSAQTERVLARMARLAEPPRTIIDVGASDGRWTAEARRSFPRTGALLIEANETHRVALARYARSHAGSVMEMTAASDHDGVLHFRALTTFGGTASNDAFGDHDTTMACAKIDTLVQSHGLPGPFFLKLDTHGHEREILNGAAETLKRTSLVQVEAYALDNHDRMRFWDLCAHLEHMGFRPAALADPMVRPLDGMLWQMDLYFLPASHPSFAQTAFQRP